MVSDIALNILIIVAAATLLALFALFIVLATKKAQKPSKRFVVVNASGEAKEQPNKAIISFAMEGNVKTSAEIESLRQKNAITVKSALDNVKKIDPNAKVETTSFRLTPNRDFTAKNNKIIDYTMSNEFSIKTKKIDEVGKIVDAALSAGVNNVSDVNYTLDNVARNRGQQHAQEEAVANARTKAQVIAQGTGATLGRVLEVEQNDNNTASPYRARAKAMAVMAAAPQTMESTPTAAPEAIDFTRNVQIKYELK